MSKGNQLKDLLKRATKGDVRVSWTADIRARRATDQESYVVIGGPGPVDVSGALVSTKVPVRYEPDGFGGSPPPVTA